MGLIRFYGLVLREAFRHSLDIAQAIIFVLLGFSGFIAARNPGLKPMLESLNLGGWQIAAMVFGSIIVIRLLLAPYWLWKAAVGRTVAVPERTVDFKLNVQSLSNRNDKKNKAIQIIFHLHNSSFLFPIRYEVEDIHVSVAGDTNEAPTFNSMTGIIASSSVGVFDFAWIRLKSKTWIKPGTQGNAGITFKYGIAGQPFVRRGKFVANFIIEKTYLRHYTLEQTDEAI